jgi:hypothetical protein
MVTTHDGRGMMSCFNDYKNLHCVLYKLIYFYNDYKIQSSLTLNEIFCIFILFFGLTMLLINLKNGK